MSPNGGSEVGTDTEPEAWDAVGTGRWMHSADRERLRRKQRRSSDRAFSTQTHSSQGKKLADVATVSWELGRPASAAEVAAEYDHCAEAYRFLDTWDGVLRAAGVGPVTDHVGRWIADIQADPYRSVRAFTAGQVARATGCKAQMVAAALGRLRDGIELEPTEGCAFGGRVVVRGRKSNSQVEWGVER